jgi:hypothetical protein
LTFSHINRDEESLINHDQHQLCQGQVSIVLVFSGPMRGVTYCIIDTYMNLGVSRDNVSALEDEDFFPGLINTDPIANDKIQLTQFEDQPLAYFFQCISIRGGQVKEEYENTVEHLESKVEEYLQCVCLPMHRKSHSFTQLPILGL